MKLIVFPAVLTGLFVRPSRMVRQGTGWTGAAGPHSRTKTFLLPRRYCETSGYS